MATKKQTITIQDVAKAAGVSVSTVSRVLNAKADVAGETVERVQAVIIRLGYTSNLAARSMRSQRKNIIGLVVPDIGSPYSIEVMKGVNKAIAESTFDLLVYTTGNIRKSGTASHEQYYISLLNNSLTDGVVIVASETVEFTSDSPIVAVDPHVVNPNYPSIQGTNYQGSMDAVNYLINLGHRRIAFIGGRPGVGSAVFRLLGYRDALENAHIPADEALIVYGDFTVETGHQCARKLLAMENPPTAIFTANDQSAIGVFQAAAELGLKIPEDISVIGFDNISEAKYLGLTTIDQSLAEMGYIAVQMLIKQINHEPPVSQIHEIPTKLVVRSSCRNVDVSQ